MEARSDDPFAQTLHEMHSYIYRVKQTLVGEPALYQEFLKVINMICKDDEVPSCVARMEEIMKDHPELIPGFEVLTAETTLLNEKLKRKSVRNELVYTSAVKATFLDEPLKIVEYLTIVRGIVTHRIDKASGIARVEELMKDQPYLLLGFSIFFPSGDFPDGPEDVKLWEDATRFILKMEARCGFDVCESFGMMFKEKSEGKISDDELQEKIVQLLHGHQDLIDEYFSFFRQT